MAVSGFSSAAEIRAFQLEELRSLLAELIPANRFYTEKFEAAGVTFDVASLDDFSRRYPITTKQEIATDQEKHPPFGSNLTYPLSRYTRFHQTSGTTGTPIRWLDTEESWDAMLEGWTEVYQAAGVRPGDRIYFAFSFGPFLGFWMAFESAVRLGCLCIPGGGLSSAARIRSIIDNGATVLCCTPTYAVRLAEAAKDSGQDPANAKIRTIIVAGEPGGSIPAIRNRLEQLWPGARVFDHHGMTEVGPVTYECPQRPCVLHVIESAYFAEVTNPATGKGVPPGEEGELILTTLSRTGSPLIRYRTGDRVRCGSGLCVCGRSELTLLGGILGRMDDMLIVRGVNIYPSAVEDIIRAFPEVAEYLVTLGREGTLADLTLQIEPQRGFVDVTTLTSRLTREIEAAFSLRVGVAVVAAGSLPRGEMKAQRWRRT